MPEDKRLTLARDRETRDRVIALLSDHFAHDVLDVEEFERRITVAHTATSLAEVEALLGDLPATAAASAPAMLAKQRPALAPASEVRQEQTVMAVMGGVDRRGSWTMPRRLRVVAMMGGAHLDLREARFPPGPVEIDVLAVMGGTEIIVPPGLAVEVHGTAIMGGFQDVNRAPAQPDPDAPLLRVHGFVMMGGVDVQMRLPGESDKDAHRRERQQRKHERKALRESRRNQRSLAARPEPSRSED